MELVAYMHGNACGHARGQGSLKARITRLREQVSTRERKETGRNAESDALDDLTLCALHDLHCALAMDAIAKISDQSRLASIAETYVNVGGRMASPHAMKWSSECS